MSYLGISVMKINLQDTITSLEKCNIVVYKTITKKMECYPFCIEKNRAGKIKTNVCRKIMIQKYKIVI